MNGTSKAWILVTPAIAIIVSGLLLVEPIRNHAIKSQLHQIVEARLKDPTSVQYRNERIVEISPGSSWHAICGEVNSKNGFGGYVGFTRYVAEDLTKDAYVEDDHGGLFDFYWDRYCKL